jgi:hypothetical protein
MIEHQRGAKTPGIIATHALLTGAWTMDVKSLEAALGRVKPEAGVNGHCRVTFFEVAGDRNLHVNVMHHAATEGVLGWAGPGATADGVVYNRTFNRMPRYQVLRQIKNMIFAAVPS